MFSFQSHNQVLYHLAQITSTINSKSISWSAKVKNQNVISANNIENVCQKSFAEAVKNCTELPAVNINMNGLIKNIRSNKNNKWVVVDNYLMSPSRELTKKHSKWKISYVSGVSFDKNKHGFPCYELTEPIILPAIYFSSKQQYKLFHNLYSNVPFHYNVQLRHFKTERNMKMELERNPTFVSRLKNWLSKPSLLDNVRGLTEAQKIGLKENFLNEIRSNDIEKLKVLFNNSELSQAEQKKIKSAFVEGYEAGLQRQLRKTRILSKLVNFLFLTGAFILLSRSFYTIFGNNRTIFSFPFGSTHEIDPEDVTVTFDDVKGVDDAKKELQDIVEYLKNPEKFTVLGGKLPKGVLLVGPPGTGKTLIARAVAGEAGVPFFYSAGPEFDEVLVGQGARRVRELFRAAKDKAPCVIFIDEIDSVGSKRTNSSLHPYANQTINQLLSEMDGFHQNEGIIVLGATNRPEDLDKAVLRPGRFDFQVIVNLPDYEGRKDILKYYLNKISSRDIDVEFLARFTSGFSGADIEYMVNQAALKAAVDGGNYVVMNHFEYARDKMLLGPPRSIQKINENTNRITAFHEAGHAIVALYTKDSDPMYKVTIIPRGLSMGHTTLVPKKGNDYDTKSSLYARMDVCMGGRAGEELVFGSDKVSTGAANDFKSATHIAELMVKQYGMSEKAGVRTFDDNEKGHANNELIESEIKRLLQESYERAKNILRTHSKEHKLLAEALLKYETLSAEEVKAIISGKSPKSQKSEIPDKETQIVDVTKNLM